MFQSEVVDSSDYKTLLCDIFYSEELKIDSPFAKNLKTILDQICCSDKAGADHIAVFWQCFSLVETDVK